jgi:hypothetical protein
MTEIVPVAKAAVSRRRSATVSASALALHLDCSRTYIGKLEAEGVIRRQGSGFLPDQSRVSYLRHLRRERRQSPRSEADADLQRAKSELIRIRIAERKRDLIPIDEAAGNVEQLIGLLLTGLGGLSARCGGLSCVVRSTKPCTNCASRYPKPAPSWRMNAASYHWTTAHDDRRRGSPTGRARRRLYCRLSRADRAHRR